MEIAGCFAYWLWLRREASLTVAALGTASLVGFAFALTRVDTAFAGRAYAAYSAYEGSILCCAEARLQRQTKRRGSLQRWMAPMQTIKATSDTQRALAAVPR
jgi:drug/metabolite transporter superfamily protein YnfA